MQYALETESGLRQKELPKVEESLIRLLTNDPRKAMRFLIRGGGDPDAVDSLTAGNLRGLDQLVASTTRLPHAVFLFAPTAVAAEVISGMAARMKAIDGKSSTYGNTESLAQPASHTNTLFCLHVHIHN